MRLFWMFLGLAVLFLIPFLIWGGLLETLFSQTGTVSWLEGYGRWAWAAGMLLLAADLVLPIPGTVIMSGLGFVYGPVWGGIISTVGSFLSGSLAYGLCRLLGRGAARRLLGEKDLEKGERLFSNVGGWIVVLSRWLPLVPEVLAGARPAVTLIETLPGLPLRLEVEPLGMIFAAVASFLWIVTSIYSIGYMRGHNESHQTRYYVCFALALGGTIGVAFAGNMLTLFIFYEVLTISTYPLVTHQGDRKSVMA